jgi:hypothetical protein
MAGALKAGEKTMVMKLAELVAWWIRDEGVQIKFTKLESRQWYRCKVIPNILPEYVIHGKLITERGIAMLCMTALQEKNYNFNLSKVISAITALTWQAYIEQCAQEEGVDPQAQNVHKFERVEQDVYDSEGTLIQPAVTAEDSNKVFRGNRYQ